MRKRINANTILGFNTCELLLICGFIGLFAMAALPQFGESRTLSQVALVKSELATLAQAVESYRLDNKSYPASYGDSPLGVIANRSECDHRLLTTPVAYINKLQPDPFKILNVVGDVSPAVVMNNYRLYAAAYNAVTTYPYYLRSFNTYPRTAWMSWSVGPDQLPNTDGYRPLGRIMLNEAETLPNIGKDKNGNYIAGSSVNIFGLRYDPTNGTLSFGDIHRFSSVALTRIN